MMALHHLSIVAKVKAHELRSKNKADLLKQLDDLKQELAQVKKWDVG